MIYNPLEEYESKLKDLHRDKTTAFFNSLVTRSGVNADQNRATVKEYKAVLESKAKLQKSLRLWRFLRVLMCITLVLIPLVILRTTPRIKKLRADIEAADKKASELLAEAHRQTDPLNSLFTDRDAITVIEDTVELLDFADCYSAEQEANMRKNFDFRENDSLEESTVDLLAGHYNGNPFLFETKLMHRMGMQVYHGYKTIRWTESYRDSEGRRRTRVRTQTLHATVTRPKPFYSTQVILNYCAQGGPNLSFTRDATNLHEKSERQLERYVKKGEKKLKKLTEDALEEDRDFVAMSNTDFEVLFDATDRNDEVEYRTLFTPLAQTNMVDLILSKTGYGDDFNFFKHKRTNRILTQHSQGRSVTLSRSVYPSYDFDEIKRNFIEKNAAYFKAVYFDLAPILAIPIYQERPVHSLDPIPDLAQNYSDKECEALVNTVDRRYVVHPATKTTAILKSDYMGRSGEGDEIKLTAYSYDTVPRVEVVPVLGGDGRVHGVPVPWDEYLPLEKINRLFVGSKKEEGGKQPLTERNGLYLLSLK